MNALLEKLAEGLARKLPEGEASDSYVPEYEIMSGAFIWKDECPNLKSLSMDELGCLRSIWRYRTSLQTGIEDKRFEELWQVLQYLRPSWIGFSKTRCNYSAELADRYNEIKTKKQK